MTATRRPITPALLRIDEAAQALGVSRAQVYVLIQRNELRSVKLGGSRRVPLAEIERIAAGTAS